VRNAGDHANEAQRPEANTWESVQRRLAELEARERRRTVAFRRIAIAGLVVGIAAPLGAEALGPVPNIFSSGDPISAAEINEDFDALVDGITAVEARASVLEGRAAALEASATGVLCGYTDPTPGSFTFVSGTAALRGYAAGSALCQSSCAPSTTAHVCSSAEIVRSEELGLVRPSAMDAAWYATGDFSSDVRTGSGTGTTGYQITDCRGFTSLDSGEAGAFWATGGGAHAPNYQGCNFAASIACCD
jgi:hypothetical protein